MKLASLVFAALFETGYKLGLGLARTETNVRQTVTSFAEYATPKMKETRRRVIAHAAVGRATVSNSFAPHRSSSKSVVEDQALSGQKARQPQKLTEKTNQESEWQSFMAADLDWL